MKLSAYQKILFTWAGLLLLGYLASIWLFTHIIVFFAMWFAIGLVGLGIQLKIGGLGSNHVKLIQLLWLIIILGGISLNIFEYTGAIPLFGGNPLIGWPIAIGFGYGVIAVLYRLNLSYILLAGLCAGFAGLVFVIQDFTTGLIVSGVMFAIICSVDGLMENTSIRKQSLMKKPSSSA